MPYQTEAQNYHQVQPPRLYKHVNKSVTHFSNVGFNKNRAGSSSSVKLNNTQLKFTMPAELIYTQEERNSRLQIQNFKVYQELRKKMESSILR